ncbi:50S ribosomal protein L24 [Candidatus Kaiserbacteria bacterium RIFCSPHIGHO2_02_FULL_49_11]|uniref:Large ribosomal subunit protein uL24 n=1 Tax=Candidatus Kaiserbacteria bacterium RIFCSPHIGHO2_02_FULL_49_11 TaxID=1798489 RepID=A0A1F6CZE9_9BACT|nr:MAG: 50S ribosomal protein L24 [Candidatus Kaiserbacteria bacterium RIFCSPHIGHO2_02_FULL_49_11]
MKIKKGDKVIIIAGKDRGKTGKVLRALPQDEKVVVEGVNMHKRHQRPTSSKQHGQIIDKAMPVHVSNIMIVDPKTGKRTRISAKRISGKYTRITKKSNTTLD